VLNKVQIIGRLGQDPQAVSDGVVRLNVATTDTWKDRESGERREKTEWHQVALFGKLAEVATTYLRKGSLVYVEGSLETRKYDKDGVTHYSTGIKGRELRMLDKRSAEEGEGAHTQTSSGVKAKSAAPAAKGATPPASAPAAQVEDDEFDLSTVPF